MSLVKLGEQLGTLLEEKGKAYGDAFNTSADFLRLYFPSGVPVECYAEALAMIRIHDKFKRIATSRKDPMGEDPWKDIAGYAMLAYHSKRTNLSDPL